MKIYILTDEPYHDNENYFGAYTTRDKAMAAMAAYRINPTNNWAPTRIVELELDAPPALHDQP